MILMELNIYGLKCDNPSCDYNDETIKFEDYPKYIEHPCPKCGQSLLTQADFDTTMQIVKMAKLASELGFDQGSPDSDKTYKMSVQLDGSGVPKFDVKEIK